MILGVRDPGGSRQKIRIIKEEITNVACECHHFVAFIQGLSHCHKKRHIFLITVVA